MSEENALDYGIETGRELERAAIVAWLRGELETSYVGPGDDTVERCIADAIERGDHEQRKERE